MICISWTGIRSPVAFANLDVKNLKWRGEIFLKRHTVALHLLVTARCLVLVAYYPLLRGCYSGKESEQSGRVCEGGRGKVRNFLFNTTIPKSYGVVLCIMTFLACYNISLVFPACHCYSYVSWCLYCVVVNWYTDSRHSIVRCWSWTTFCIKWSWKR